MSDWRAFVNTYCTGNGNLNNLTNIELMNEYRIYPCSVNASDKCTCFMTWEDAEKILVVTGGTEMSRFEGYEENVGGRTVKLCPLNNVNSYVLRSIFEFTNPTVNRKYDMSFGLGDRLGLASQGHIRLIKDKNIFPVLAQQSIRELNLTDRTFEDVLASAVWAVFQEGYRDGFGADGDHLKTAEEVRRALDSGYTMITLDCSEHIETGIDGLPEELLKNRYAALDDEERGYWEGKYLSRTFEIDSGIGISISESELMETVLMYKEVVSFIEEIYHKVIRACARNIDFEISIDETSSATSPGVHYMIASELKDHGVQFMSLAPRFCGEFQKGIDYKGDIQQFGKELSSHAAIARHFGYKLSIHSGSDKFSAFPAIGELTKHKFHLKTAGTNWLEALGVIASVDLEFFLSVYRFSLEKLDDAKRYYHIFAERYMAPSAEGVAEDPLRYIRSDETVRQVLHVTYGYILCERHSDGRFVFRDRLYRILNENEESYCDALYRHIKRHLLYLGVCA